MRITDRYERLMDGVRGAATKPSDVTAEGARATRPSGTLEVSVSARARELAASASRLEELKTAIADGAYSVDPRAIAARIVGGDDP